MSADRQQAIQQFLALAASNGGDGKTWPEYEKSGYACNPFALVAVETNGTMSGHSESGDDHA